MGTGMRLLTGRAARQGVAVRDRHLLFFLIKNYYCLMVGYFLRFSQTLNLERIPGPSQCPGTPQWSPLSLSLSLSLSLTL